MPPEHQGTGSFWAFNVAELAEVVVIAATLWLMHRQHQKELRQMRSQHHEDLEHVRLQLNQSIRHKAVELSIERNRQHLIEPEQFPVDLPYWKGLSEEERRWRVFLLNHLNLLYLVFEDSRRDLVDEDEFQDWKNKATRILGDVCKTGSPGLPVLQQLLKPEEGVGSSKFREWLKQEGVVPPDLLPADDD